MAADPDLLSEKFLRQDWNRIRDKIRIKSRIYNNIGSAALTCFISMSSGFQLALVKEYFRNLQNLSRMRVYS